jgi:hypothetical protein
MLARAITTAMVPVRAVLAGSPVLARRLYAPTAERRAKEAALREQAAAALAQARAAELAKLTGDALLKAQQAHAEEDRAERKVSRSKAADAAGGVLFLAFVGGPVAWSIVGPWAPAAFWSAALAWCVAAMMHAPARPADEQQAEPERDEQPADGPGEPSPERLRAAVVERLLDWVGDRRGIHLAEVYERYRQLPGHQHLADTQIRAALVDHYAIPVRPAVRIGDKVARGIHRDDLQPLPSPAVADPVADQRNNAVTSTVAA